jgi:hypothetical protein
MHFSTLRCFRQQITDFLSKVPSWSVTLKHHVQEPPQRILWRTFTVPRLLQIGGCPWRKQSTSPAATERSKRWCFWNVNLGSR